MFSARCALRSVSRQLVRRPVVARLPQQAARTVHSAAFRQQQRALVRSSSARQFTSEEVEEDDDDEYEEDDERATVRVGELAPDFECQGAFKGEIQTFRLSDFEGQWLVLFFYPLNFTFVCPTEIIEFSNRAKEFADVGCSVVGASVDSHFSHLAWSKMPQKEGGLGGNLQIPLLGDNGLALSSAYDALNVEGTHTLRATYVIDPKGVLRHISVNDAPVGRNVDEYLRIVKALQFADTHGEVCPANWKPGADTIKPNPKESLEYFQKAGKD